MSSIYIITGIMASGKSTVAELLAQKLKKSVHLRGDVFRRMVTSGRQDMAAEPSEEAVRQLNLRYDLAAICAERYYAAGFDVVLQDIYIGKVLQEVLARITVRPLHLTILCPNPEVVDEREKERSKIGYGGGFTPQNMHNILMRETPHIGLWLDSSALTPEQTVNIILDSSSKGEGMIL